MRAIYRKDYAACGDCGHRKPVTRIAFWVNGYEMFICSSCKRAYQYPHGNIQPVKDWRRAA